MKKTRSLSIIIVLSLVMTLLFSYSYAADNAAAPATGTLPSGTAPAGSPPDGAAATAAVASSLSASDTSKYFTDLGKATSGYNAYIDALYEKGLVNGTAKGIFSPNSKISRADFILILYRNYKYADSSENFTDVKSTAYYSKAVAAAKGKGIVSGKTFSPKTAITKEEAAMYLFASLGLQDAMTSTDISAYSDSKSISTDAVKAVGTLTSLGILTADKSGRLNPKSGLTRAEMAVILYKAVSLGSSSAAGTAGGPGAPGGMMGGPGGGPGGPPGGGDGSHAKAAVYVSGNTRDTSKEYTDGSVTVDNPKNIGKDSASNVMLTSKSYTATGMVITGKSTYTIGGTEKNYKVYSTKSKNYVGTGIAASNGSDLLGSFNSVLLFTLDGKVASDATTGSSGIDVDKTSTLNLSNVYLQVDGARRYVVSNYNDGTMVVNDSYIVSTGNADGNTGDIAVPFSNEALLISGTARTNFSIGATKTYYFNSTVVAEGWASLSTDSATGDGLDLYAYNTKASATNGGYATYADTNCRVWLYGSDLQAGEIGAIISKSGKITVTDGASAGKAVTALNTGAATTSGSTLTGGRNAVMIHAPDMMGTGIGAIDCGTLDVRNGALVTSRDLKSTFDYSTYSKETKSYVDYVSGDDVLIKSTSADINLDSAEMTSYNGVLVHTVLNADSMGNFLKAGDNEKAKPVAISMKNMTVTGNILHEDYHRNMTVTLDKTSLTGAIVQGTFDSWKSLWSAKGVTKANWLKDTSWTGSNSLAVTVKSGSTWTVAGTSSASSLTIETGAAVNAPSGKTLTMTVDGKDTKIAAGSYKGSIVLTVK
ncbi:MAG: S-layer homology domain-containing protein [Clostridiales bacterium]|nr:S-layer homology domain-containing protein [Clostridiales bacterium]